MKPMIFPKTAATSPLSLVDRDEQIYRESISRAARMTLEVGARFVFLAGPSCSGKTTTSLSLVSALSDCGKRVLTFSTDDFFFDGIHAPKNEDGTPNYDAFEHTDSAYIISVLLALSQGKKADLPIFNFETGNRESKTVPIDPENYDIFILEGIHALNDRILSAMPKEEKVACFYLDVTQGVQMEGESTYLLPEDVRFCRRLIRDFKHRFADAERTFSLWKNVRHSEAEILHPFRKNALFTITTDFCYEIAVEKDQAVALLQEISPDSPYYEKSRELLCALSAFPSWEKNIVPENSVLREFID